MKKRYLIIGLISLMLLPSLLITVHFLDIIVNYFSIKIVYIAGFPFSIAFLREFLFFLIVIIVIINSIVLLLVIIEK